MRFTQNLVLSLSLALTAALGFGAVAQADDHGMMKPMMEMSEDSDDDMAMMAPTVVDIAMGNEAFSTLVAAVSAADLVETLSGAGPFTVFAPTNDAFAALPEGTLETLLLPENKELLTKILTYHVVSGNVLSSDLSAGAVPTVEGSDIMVSLEDGVMVNNAKVLMADIEAGNGVVHVIDTVILPPDLLAAGAES
ncbi:MAG: fasciclin domain-containing protein [Synechococcus sp.]|nr:fasciclin domain-containing protein [Synechococcus sp.]